ncbi:MAG: alpha-glucuronidase [Firmicutes bacterium]|nr:alpha-glucuronidase [Bacillota bacterium]
MAANYKELRDYGCWLNYDLLPPELLARYAGQLQTTAVVGAETLTQAITAELRRGLRGLLGQEPRVVEQAAEAAVEVRLVERSEESMNPEGFRLSVREEQGALRVVIASPGEQGLLYGTFAFLRALQLGEIAAGLEREDWPRTPLRLLNHWDNLDGSIERGYAGRSIFFRDNDLVEDLDRVRDYARLLASLGINGVAVNNVNVHREETQLIAAKLELVRVISSIFREYGIRLFLSINFATPLEFGLDTADPLNSEVREWWRDRAAQIYSVIPDLGGFLVKADSENRPGPFTYGRSHAEGANMLAEALEPFGGIVVWRCFVYNCAQDWRDTKTDRARAAYDHFMPLDGLFRDNVILQIKNGPMDFQVREPVSPLFGGLERTNQVLELQITQEYTGQQRHLCYLVPQWKEILAFDTYAQGPGTTVAKIVTGSVFPQRWSGLAAVANIGDDPNWTGHTLAQANLYGYGRLAWDPELTSEQITREWVVLTFGHDPEVVATVSELLLGSWQVYENYTVPLGIGWMCNPGHHYGPSPEGYEYSRWGTYHRADRTAIGVDRSVRSGTGFAGQYRPENARRYETVETCPEELLLFFHRIPYTHVLKSGKTLIQHIYDTHFLGVEQVEEMIEKWKGLEGKINPETFFHVLERLEGQLVDAKEWRDVLNTYFYRLTHIPDIHGRKIYP